MMHDLYTKGKVFFHSLLNMFQYYEQWRQDEFESGWKAMSSAKRHKYFFVVPLHFFGYVCTFR